MKFNFSINQKGCSGLLGHVGVSQYCASSTFKVAKNADKIGCKSFFLVG